MLELAVTATFNGDPLQHWSGLSALQPVFANGRSWLYAGSAATGGYQWLELAEAQAAVWRGSSTIAVSAGQNEAGASYRLSDLVMLQHGNQNRLLGSNLSNGYIDAQVINIHTIKPLDEELVVKAAQATGRVFTVEEHSIIGGLGSAVMECLAEKNPVKVTRIGVRDTFGESGPAKDLLHKYELDAEGIYKQIKAAL